MDEAWVEEARELLIDVRAASEDGRRLAARYADLLQGVVGAYCEALDSRAQALLERLEQAA